MTAKRRRKLQALAAALKQRGYRITTGGTDNHMVLVKADVDEFEALYRLRGVDGFVGA